MVIPTQRSSIICCNLLNSGLRRAKRVDMVQSPKVVEPFQRANRRTVRRDGFRGSFPVKTPWMPSRRAVRLSFFSRLAPARWYRAGAIMSGSPVSLRRPSWASESVSAARCFTGEFPAKLPCKSSWCAEGRLSCSGYMLSHKEMCVIIAKNQNSTWPDYSFIVYAIGRWW